MAVQANPDSVTTPYETPVTIPVLANDTRNGVAPVTLADLAGPPIITVTPSVGSAGVNPDGTITYTPPPAYAGVVTFTYRITEGDAPPEALVMYGLQELTTGDEFRVTATPPGDFEFSIQDASNPAGPWTWHALSNNTLAPIVADITTATGVWKVRRVSGTAEASVAVAGDGLRAVTDWAGAVAANVSTIRFRTNTQVASAPNLVTVPGYLPSSITSTLNMFRGALSFNSSAVTGWNTSNVIEMGGMFQSAQQFNRDLSGWCVENIVAEPSNFADGATAWVLPKPNWGAPC